MPNVYVHTFSPVAVNLLVDGLGFLFSVPLRRVRIRSVKGHIKFSSSSSSSAFPAMLALQSGE